MMNRHCRICCWSVDGTNVGMLKCDSQKILCGSTNILQGALEDPFAVVDDYTLNPADRFGYTDMVGIVQNWAGNWFTAVTKYVILQVVRVGFMPMSGSTKPLVRLTPSTMSTSHWASINRCLGLGLWGCC